MDSVSLLGGEKKIKVLHILPAANVGGMSSVVFTLYSNMDRETFKFDIALTTQFFGIDGEKLSALGCNFYFIPAKSKDYRGYKKGLKEILKKGDYDAIHIHENETSFVALRIAKKLGVRCRIAHSHSSSPGKTLQERIKRVLGHILNYKYATHIIACGELAGARVFGKNNMKKAKATVLLNPVDKEKFAFNQETRETMRESLYLKNEFVIGMVARLSPEKNQSFAIEVFEKLFSAHKNVRLVLVGNGPDEEQLKGDVKTRGLESVVSFLGARSDVNQLYNAFDVSILTSKYEGYPIVGIESLFNGLPLVLMDTITNELVKYENTIYCSYNVSKWVEALELIMNQSGSRGSKSISQQLIDDFDVQNAVKRLCDYYLSDSRK
ncbi:MAG: glycosyltransferase [Clostridia bacterium]|nr:glycosyltransferase [Clostridia bacterium]